MITREELWARLSDPWDIVVVGGGITGAGILREATRAGLRALLVEQRDFAWGTSSRSSKLVHGGLRYLKEGQLRLTRAAVRERERLLGEAPGLIDPLGFLLPTYEGDSPGRWTYGAGLSVYDLLALRWSHRHYAAADFQMLLPRLTIEGLAGGFRYGDAQTDDARLVMRVIKEAVAAGAVALNYTVAEEIVRDGDRVSGVRLRDVLTDRAIEVRSAAVMNATGAWATHLTRTSPAAIRPLRGSHLVFPSWRLRVAQAVSFLHPIDQRPVFVLPWEGVTVVGTTDIDHDRPLNEEPRIAPEEVAYLFAAIDARFPSLALTLDDVTSTYSGVRPVVSSGEKDPSKESRDHAVWQDNGLVTVTGGKLTTFRLIALDALDAVRHLFPHARQLDKRQPVLDPVDPDLPECRQLGDESRRRVLGRYGSEAVELVKAANAGELEPIEGTTALWAELRWAARSEWVVHLEDLLLRRVRVGLLLPEGGRSILPAIRRICQGELGWDDKRWDAEEGSYLELWRSRYSLPDRRSIPDWRSMLAEAATRRHRSDARRTLTIGALIVAALAALLVLLAIVR